MLLSQSLFGREMCSVKKKVMIVDDEKDIRELFTSILEDSYSIIEASGGKECLEKLKTEKPDTILLDILMPKMDGWQVLKEIKENKELRDIPVIMLSSVKPELSVVEKEIAGYLVKPVSKHALVNAIESIFHVREILKDYEGAVITRGVRRDPVDEYKTKIQQLEKTERLYNTLKQASMEKYSHNSFNCWFWNVALYRLLRQVSMEKPSDDPSQRSLLRSLERAVNSQTKDVSRLQAKIEHRIENLNEMQNFPDNS